MHNKSDINFIARDFETAAAKHASVCEADICVCAKLHLRKLEDIYTV